MITAKNYAAQAEKSLRKLSEETVSSEYSAFFSSVADIIKGSVHFVIPNNGKLLNGYGRSLQGQTINLPFPCISIEYCVDEFITAKIDGVPVEFAPKRLVVAMEAPGHSHPTAAHMGADKVIMIFGLSTRIGGGDIWVLSQGLHVIPCNGWDSAPLEATSIGDVIGDGVGVFSHTTLFGPGAPKTGSVKKELIHRAQIDGVSDIRAVIELIEALGCRNVTTTPSQLESQKNPSRERAGKLPIYETRILVLDGRSSARSKNGGAHSSPRQHLRRGHIRRLQGGNVWVNSCIVGDPKKGEIKKDYLVDMP